MNSATAYTVGEAMTKDVLTVDPSASIGEAAEKMQAANVGAVVVLLLRGAVMAGHPLPPDPVRPVRRLEPLPQIDVLDRLLVGCLPAAPLPVVHPFGNALLHVLRIGVQNDPARTLQRFQRADCAQQFHAVVRGMRLAAAQFEFLAIELQQRAPAAGARISLACAIGEYLDCVAHDDLFVHCVSVVSVWCEAFRFSLGRTGSRLPTSRPFHNGLIGRTPGTRFTACRK